MLIKDDNLSIAWGKAVRHAVDQAGTLISPLLVSVSGFVDGVPAEDPQIRSALDAALARIGEQEVHTVANTIFPVSLWRYVGRNRQAFFQEYLKAVPRFKALAPAKNYRGLYLERMINYGRGDTRTNQLEFIITQYSRRKGVRASLLQAGVFDPLVDHTSAAQLGFPCLQHISFAVTGNRSLTLNAFYATQQLFTKAYGNYLGLCRLGQFMAHEMGLNLSRMNCFIGLAKLERIQKGSRALAPVLTAIRRGLELTASEASQGIEGS